MNHQRSLSGGVWLLIGVLLAACSTVPTSTVELEVPGETQAVESQTEPTETLSDPPPHWQPDRALTALFNRRAQELGEAETKDCGVGREWIFSFRSDRPAVDACVTDALANNTPFRAQFAYFDIDTSQNTFMFTTPDNTLCILDASLPPGPSGIQIDEVACPDPRFAEGILPLICGDLREK